MRTPPIAEYSGVTFIIDKPSRLDSTHLLTGIVAQWLEDEVIKPYKVSNLDIRDTSENIPLLPNTKYIALLGRQAAAKFGADINKHGYPHFAYGKPAVVAYYPQDCCDHRNIEGLDDDDDDEQMSDRDIKDAAPTRRANYRFWTRWHVRKLLFTERQNHPKIIIKHYPNLDQLSSLLNSTNNEDLYIDIETSRVHRCITCIGLSTTSIWPTIYVVPVYLYNGNLAYSNFATFYKALVNAFLHNTIVGHNISGFDLLVLRAFYKFPLPPNSYDTMLANHRCFPDIEKSLAHVISQWTWLPYHKDQNIEAYSMSTQEQGWNYNAKDVYALKLIKDAQLKYATTIPGLPASIAQANSMILPYISNSIQGLHLNRAQLQITSAQLSIATRQYERIASILVGKPFNPRSPDQCKKFFHDQLNYPIQAYTEARKPKLGKKQLHQLLIKTNNPLIRVILKHRKVAKDNSMLESELWKLP